MGIHEETNAMSVISGEYGGMCSFDSLYYAYRCARYGKRYRQDVMEFASRLEENLIELSNDLQWGSYRIGPYRQFYITTPKKRLIMALPFRDRIVQWAEYNILNPFYERMFIEDSYACRNGKGTLAAADKLQYWLRQADRKPGRWSFLKMDISKFFYRVDHTALERILRKRIKDERLMELLCMTINSEDTKFGLPRGRSPDDCGPDDWLFDVGIPIGNITSQVFANIYLNELDQYAKHELRCRRYIRYMDDIIILHEDAEQLAAWKDDIENFLLEELRLDLNDKTKIGPISGGVEFVGYRIWPTHRTMKPATASKMVKDFRERCEMVKNGEMTYESLRRAVDSYNGLLKHCRSDATRRKLNRAALEAGIFNGGGPHELF